MVLNPPRHKRKAKMGDIRETLDRFLSAFSNRVLMREAVEY